MRPRVSVCMATYRGREFVTAQLASIVDQLADDDEVVVVDDASPDDTVAVVEAFGDARIRVIRSPRNQGYVRTFERALGEARGTCLLLADQDDVWLPGRAETLVQALGSAQVAASNLVTLAGPDGIQGPFGGDWRLRSTDSRRHVRNVVATLLGRRPYYGCAMAVRREALDVLLPFPPYLVESHDLYIALYGNRAASMRHLDQPTIQRRLHADNSTTQRPRGLRQALGSRLMLLRCLVELDRRLRSKGRARV